jgi:hypothetical protein
LEVGPRGDSQKGVFNQTAASGPRSWHEEIHRTVPRVSEFRDHETFVRSLIKKIPAEANKLARQANKYPDSERARWTKAVKNVFHAEALELGKEIIDFYGTRSEPEKKYHEWLLDAVLYVEGRGILVAVESEFGRNIKGVVYDFWKLLSIKAALKILILDSGKPETRYAKKLFGEINKYAQGFEQYLPREIYYLIDFHDGRQDVYRYVISSRCPQGRAKKFNFEHLPSLSS